MKSLCEEFSGDNLKKKVKKKSRRTTKRSNLPSIIIDQPVKDPFYPSRRLIPSQSCPALFSSPIEHRLPLSSSLETLFSSVSTRDCVCQEIHLEEQINSMEEYPRLTCLRCSSTRTDLGYSSGRSTNHFMDLVLLLIDLELDDISSSGLCDCLLQENSRSNNPTVISMCHLHRWGFS